MTAQRTQVLAVLLCIGLASATLTIPLKSQKVTKTENGAEVLVDEVHYVDGKVSNLGSANLHEEKLLVDLQATTNYVLSSETKYGANAVSSTAFNCNGQCTGTA